MKIPKLIVAFVLTITTVLFIAAPVSAAATPTLSLSSASDGDSVGLTITGPADSSVIFYYMKTVNLGALTMAALNK